MIIHDKKGGECLCWGSINLRVCVCMGQDKLVRFVRFWVFCVCAAYLLLILYREGFKSVSFSELELCVS